MSGHSSTGADAAREPAPPTHRPGGDEVAELGVLTSEFDCGSLERTLDAVVRHGLGTVQLQLGSAVPQVPLKASLGQGLHVLGDHLGPALATQVHEQLAARGLGLSAVDGTFNMIHPDEAQRRQGYEALFRLIELCGALGTSVVTLCTGSRSPGMWSRHPDNSSPQAWRDLVAGVGEAASTAERFGVTLAFEPEVSNVVDSAQAARRLLDEVGSPHLKVLMDAANIFGAGELPRMGEKLQEAFDLVGDDIALAHAKDLDHDGEAGGLGAGRGVLDYATYLSLLHERGFTGAVVLHQMHGLDDAAVAGCIAHVRAQAPQGYLQ
jgi:sugar phosphate isomerase/epimerase